MIENREVSQLVLFGMILYRIKICKSIHFWIHDYYVKPLLRLANFMLVLLSLFQRHIFIKELYFFI